MQAKRWTIAILNFTLVLVAFCANAHAAKNPPAKPIDINAANVKELQELPGVGPVMAQRIIDMRTKSGHFRRVEDLLAVRGISQKKLDAMRPYVVVAAASTPASPAKKNTSPAKKPSPQ